MSASKFKLKLHTGNTSAAPSTAPPDAAQTPTTGLKLSFTKPAQPGPNAASIKSSAKTPRSASSKKRAYDETDPTPAALSASKKLKPTILRLNAGAQAEPTRKSSIIKLKKSDAIAASPSTPGIRALKIKHKGKPPPRPAGVGYDSECSDAEEDPAIEENLILRMEPGPDAEYIRKAIEERKVGVPVREGGADMSLRFFSRDARNACVRVQDRYYGAVLVDLPCVVESMKSWDKKGWWKAADICQMLLVTGRVANEDAAKDVLPPKDVDAKTHAYPHGLTPPMWNVRQRRFRKRASHKTIEQAEEEVERLLAEDAKAEERGGSSTYKNLKWEELRREEEGDMDDLEADVDRDVNDAGIDAEGDFDELAGEEDDEDEDEDDDEAFVKQFHAAGDIDYTTATPNPQPATPQSMIGARVDGGAAGEDIGTESAAEESHEGEEEDEDESEEDEEEEDEDEEEEDEQDLSDGTREKRDLIAQQKEEIAHLEQQIADKRKQLAAAANPIMRGRMMNTIKMLEEDRDVKKRGIGMAVGDEDDDGD